jgi:hypothetical protein
VIWQNKVVGGKAGGSEFIRGFAKSFILNDRFYPNEFKTTKEAKQ